MFVSDVIKTRVWWPIAANQKKKKYKNKKYFIQKKNPQNYLGPRKIKKWKNKKEYYSEKNQQNYHDPWVPNLIRFLDRF